MGKNLPTPRGFSASSAAIWADLLAENAFERHELPLLESALRWRDKSATWLTESETVTGRDQARLVKQSLDAAQTSLRHWKALKFRDLDVPARRPGRQPGDEWNAKRRQQAMKAII